MTKQEWRDGDTLRRLIDDGGPLPFMQPTGSDRDGEGLLVYTGACDNPDCPCQDLLLRACPARRVPGGKVMVAGHRAIQATLDVATMTLSVKQDSASAAPLDADLVGWLRDGVASHAKLLAQRLARIRGQNDPDQWRRQDRRRLLVDAMVPYCDAFPDSWDLTVPLGDRWYWALDSYCLNPGCDCEEVVLELLDRSREDSGLPFVGLVRVGLGRWKDAEVEGGVLAQRVWRRLLVHTHRGTGRRTKVELRRRFKQMRRVAAELDEVVAADLAAHAAAGATRDVQRADTSKERRAGPGRRVGRNEPCPCGSGRKYKRCCLKK